MRYDRGSPTAKTSAASALPPQQDRRRVVDRIDLIGPAEVVRTVLKKILTLAGAVALLAMTPSPVNAIVGGTLARPGDAPWQVEVKRSGWGGNFAHDCGGVIIDARTVVTAAHCVDGTAASSLQVGYGSLNHSNATAVAVQTVRRHENYDSSTKTNDVAILKLAADIPLNSGNPNIGTIHLATDGDDPAKGTTVTATGWGATRQGGQFATLLHKVSVPIVDRPACDTAYASQGGIDDSMICAGEPEGGKDRCRGDDGGPLVTFHDGTATLEGIASWGNGCGVKGYPGVYARIGWLRGWIDANRN
jgi:trypsin